MLDVMGHGSEAFERVRNLLAAFYVHLKSNSEFIRCVFLTGVYKFAKTSIFSGLNNLYDLTMKSQAALLFGYTEAEIRHFFADHLEVLAKKLGMSVDETMGVLQEQFNGYTFGVDFTNGALSQSVYNPFAIGNTLADQQIEDSWFESGSTSSLMQLLKKSEFDVVFPDHLLIPYAALTGAGDLASVTPLSMLFFAGYFTVKQYDVEHREMLLGYPNEEVARAFSQKLLPAVSNKQLTVFGLTLK